MASLRAPALRHLLTSSARTLRASNQRRWAQVHDVRFLATTQQPRAVVEKYREKLDQKARQEGHGSIDELKAAYSDKIDDQRKKEVERFAQAPPGQQQQSPLPPQQEPTPPPSPTASDPSSSTQNSTTGTEAAASSSSSKASEASPSPTSGSSATNSGIKPLSEILDISKARHLPEKELTAVWRLRYAQHPNSVVAVLPAHTFDAMASAARRNPQFVLPVPRDGQGAEMHFLQWQFDPETSTASVMFTQLAEFKARGEYAQPHTTVTHHTDLAGDAGLVLMQGQVVDGRGANVEDARWLVMCLQRFYGAWDAGLDGGADGKGDVDAVRLERAVERRRLLEYFSQADPRFTVEKLLEETERMG